MPILETERLILRDFVLSDWDALNAFLSDPSVIRFMHFASWDEGKRREWFARLVQDASNPHQDTYNWAITLRSNGLLVLIASQNQWQSHGQVLISSMRGCQARVPLIIVQEYQRSTPQNFAGAPSQSARNQLVCIHRLAMPINVDSASRFLL